jgi:hypothetical protein
MTVVNLPTAHRPPHRRGPTNCVLCDGQLVAVPMLGSMGCADCGSTFTLDGLAAHRRRENAAASGDPTEGK